MSYTPGRASTSTAWGSHGAQVPIGKTIPSTGVGAGTNLASGGLYASPIVVGRSLWTFDQIGCQITAIGSGATLQLSLYTTNLDTMYPDQLVADAGSVPVAALGSLAATLTAALGKLPAGDYHGVLKHIATTTVAAVMYGNADIGRPFYGGASHGSGGAQCGWFVGSQTAGAMPQTFPTGGTVVNGSSPLITIRRSA